MSSEKKPQPEVWVCEADAKLVKARDGYDISVSPRIRPDLGMEFPLYSEATIEALRAERDEARKSAFKNGTELCRQRTRAEAAEARVVQLEAALRDARDEVEHWGQYASGYLQEKHGLKQALATIDRALLSEKGTAE